MWTPHFSLHKWHCLAQNRQLAAFLLAGANWFLFRLKRAQNWNIAPATFNIWSTNYISFWLNNNKNLLKLNIYTKINMYIYTVINNFLKKLNFKKYFCSWKNYYTKYRILFFYNICVNISLYTYLMNKSLIGFLIS